MCSYKSWVVTFKLLFVMKTAWNTQICHCRGFEMVSVFSFFRGGVVFAFFYPTITCWGLYKKRPFWVQMQTRIRLSSFSHLIFRCWTDAICVLPCETRYVKRVAVVHNEFPRLIMLTGKLQLLPRKWTFHPINSISSTYTAVLGAKKQTPPIRNAQGHIPHF